MVAGHLQEKKGKYYIVLNFKDENGKRKTQWKSTGLTVKGNKKKAEEMLQTARQQFVPPHQIKEGIMFSDYLEKWVELHKVNVEETTYCNYKSFIGRINEYFRPKNLLLQDVKPKDIQEFYFERMKTLKSSTVLNYHLVLHNAFVYAVKMDILPSNPCDKVERPKPADSKATFCDEGEIQKLYNVVKDTKLDLIVRMALFYGMRRSEVIGLKWRAVDFKNDTVTVNHTVTMTSDDGKLRLIAKDRAKTKSSLRTYPLTEEFKQELLNRKEWIEENKKLCGKSYTNEYGEYVFVNELGELITPNEVTFTFWYLVKKHKLKKMRFHDLRHTCASLMVANGVNMKQIQDWLGHSTFLTTADIYSHLDSSSKQLSANAMTEALRNVV